MYFCIFRKLALFYIVYTYIDMCKSLVKENCTLAVRLDICLDDYSHKKYKREMYDIHHMWLKYTYI